MRRIQAGGLTLALAIGALGALVAGARAQESATPTQRSAPPQQAAPAAQPSATASAPVDLTGDWKLDPAHSDMPPMGGGGREGGGYGGHGHGGGGGYGGGGYGGGHGGSAGGNASAEGGRGGRGPRLPELIHITQTPTLVSFEDSSGVVLQEIATVAAAADTMARAPGALHVTGTWDGKMLTVTHESQRGKVRETWQLEKSGQAIDQVVAFDSEQGSRTMKRVYRRIEQP
jgi:hypothetical protein